MLSGVFQPGQQAEYRNAATGGEEVIASGGTREGHIGSAELGSGAGPAFQPDEERRSAPMTSDWPLRSCLELAALPGAVPCARLHARQVLWEWGHGAVAESAELPVSEIVTNAL